MPRHTSISHHQPLLSQPQPTQPTQEPLYYTSHSIIPNIPPQIPMIIWYNITLSHQYIHQTHEPLITCNPTHPTSWSATTYPYKYIHIPYTHYIRANLYHILVTNIKFTMKHPPPTGSTHKYKPPHPYISTAKPGKPVILHQPRKSQKSGENRKMG